MADLGSIAVDADMSEGVASGVLSTLRIRRIVTEESDSQILGRKDLVEGTPSPPSLCLEARGVLKVFAWALTSGSHQISIQVKQAANLSPRPSLRILASPDIGVNADVTDSAPAGTGWVTIGPLSVSPSSDGVLWVQVENNVDGQAGTMPCYWKNLSWT